MSINVKLLREVQSLIRTEPRKVDMGMMLGDAKVLPAEERPPCGTIGCIAGWSVAISKPNESLAKLRKLSSNMWDSASDLLGLTEGEAGRLFNDPTDSLRECDVYNYDEDEDSDNLVRDLDMYDEGNNWPVDLALQYEAAETPKDRAEVVIKRIDRFIETKGAE